MPGPVFIDGETVNLRTIEEEDVEFIHEHKNDPRIWLPVGWPWPANRTQHREFFEETLSDDESVSLLIAVEGEPVGMTNFHELEQESDRGELGYWIAPEQQKQGYGTEAVGLLVEYGFAQLGLHRVGARVFEFNEASGALLEKLGFTHEGVNREAAFFEGEYQDVHWYSVLESEWEW